MRYIIKIWETEEMRNSGESDIIQTDIKSLKEAIDRAKKIMEEQNYASLDVQNTKENCSFYYCTPRTEEYIYNDIVHNLENTDIVKSIIELYFIENDINNLMHYGADRDSLVMLSLSELYKEILDKLHIEYTSIETDDISDGKYKTDIEFKDNSIIRVDTSSFNNIDTVISNVESIKQVYEKIKEKEMNKDKLAERFAEDKRMQGKWFQPEIYQNCYWNHDKDIFYLIDEQDKYLIKLDTPELRILLNNLYMSRGGSEIIDYLKDKSKSNFKYFESIEEFDKYQKELLNEFENEDECEFE